MKVCPACAELRSSFEMPCAACGHVVPNRGDILLLAPEFADDSDGFEAEYFSNLIEVEEGSFWFRGRSRVIQWMVRRYCPRITKFLEIGCGTGYVVGGLAAAFPHMHFWGSEVFVAGLVSAKARAPGIHYLQMDARRIPYVDEFDVIGAFDVLEHIKDDNQAVAEIRRALKPGGYFLVTVPQHMWLWGPSDEYARHARRYSPKGIVRLVTTHGFEVVRTSSFVTLLLPLMACSRITQRWRRATAFDPASEFKLPRWIDLLLEATLRVEAALIRWGVSFPIGGSRFVVARKV